jgi:hypothetical protein
VANGSWSFGTVGMWEVDEAFAEGVEEPRTDDVECGGKEECGTESSERDIVRECARDRSCWRARLLHEFVCENGGRARSLDVFFTTPFASTFEALIASCLQLTTTTH